MQTRRGRAEIKVIENGFLLIHDYPNLERVTYFKDLEDLFAFLKEKVFCGIKLIELD